MVRHNTHPFASLSQTMKLSPTTNQGTPMQRAVMVPVGVEKPLKEVVASPVLVMLVDFALRSAAPPKAVPSRLVGTAAVV